MEVLFILISIIFIVLLLIAYYLISKKYTAKEEELINQLRILEYNLQIKEVKQKINGEIDGCKINSVG